VLLPVARGCIRSERIWFEGEIANGCLYGKRLNKRRYGEDGDYEPVKIALARCLEAGEPIEMDQIVCDLKARVHLLYATLTDAWF
jgi:hypothetical protein